MIEKLLLFGATGDLAGRFLFPALAALCAAGKLPDDFHIVGSAISNRSDEEFQRHVAQRLEEHAANIPAAARASLLQALRYKAVDFNDARSVAAVLSHGDR